MNLHTSNREQFTINIRSVDTVLKVSEYFIRLNHVDSISSESLAIVLAIRDTLVQLNTTMADCRGQCYDGASNMSGARNVVVSILLKEESRALHTHCYAHALNLVVSDTVKQSNIYAGML